MDLPISYIIEYTPIDYRGMYFETSLRHITEYDMLLTEIETKSKQLDELLKQIRGSCDYTRLSECIQLQKDHEFFVEALVHRHGTYEFGEYCRAMMDTISKHLEIIGDRVRQSVNHNLYHQAEELYQEISFLLDDKYNEHDKYYMD